MDKVISPWANTQAKAEVACPKCYSQAGFGCLTPKGRKVGIHALRSKSYRDKIGPEEFRRRHQITIWKNPPQY